METEDVVIYTARCVGYPGAPFLLEVFDVDDNLVAIKEFESLSDRTIHLRMLKDYNPYFALLAARK